MSALAMLIALIIDWRIGWPEALMRRVGHPVQWCGALIAWLEHQGNREGDPPARQRAAGVACSLVAIGSSAGIAALISAVLPGGWIGVALTGLLAAPLVAARSLKSHVAAVFDPLARGDVAAARRAVAMIVGRDPARLDAAGVSRAALESLAENTSDGVTAPLFWGALLGLPGIAAYKAVNTLDSMIGHRSVRYQHFGSFAARLDDFANWLPARATGLVMCIVAPARRRAFTVMRRDASRHRSPNAGWPEAALAGALGIRLSGPRVYAEAVADEPWLNPGGSDPGPAAGRAAMAIYERSVAVLGIALLVWGLLTGGLL